MTELYASPHTVRFIRVQEYVIRFVYTSFHHKIKLAEKHVAVGEIPIQKQEFQAPKEAMQVLVVLYL
jgi:hypothetical protein